MTEQAQAPTPTDLNYALPEWDDEIVTLMEQKVEPEPEEGPLIPGSIIEASVHEVGTDMVYVALTDEVFGRCDVDDARFVGSEEVTLEVGEKVQVLLEQEIDENRWEISIGKVRHLDIYSKLEQLAADKGRVRGTIRLVVRGGFAVEAEGIRSFLPGRESGIRYHEAHDAIGREMEFDVMRFDRRRGQLVLTRKALAQAERKEQVEALMAELKVGDRKVGTVTAVKPYGAFVDIGGIEGLLHVSEMGAGHIENPGDVIRAGDQVEVQIVELNRDNGRIGLSRREIDAGKIAEAIEGLEVGAVVDGTVTKLADFGAFIEIAQGLEGLCHISELSWTERPNHPSEIVAQGAAVQVKILSADADRQRISLSIRQAETNPWDDFLTANAIGSVVKGEITRIEDYGLFIKLADEIEGLCHVSDLTWEGRPERPADAGDFAIGGEVEVKILSAEPERQRVKLGIKQLEGDPWDDAGDKVTVGTIFTATVTRFTENAAFFEVVPGLEGRMHISEVSMDRIDSIRSVLRPSQEVEVMTITADRDRRRLDLSIKAIAIKQEAETPKSYQDDASEMNPLKAALAGLVSDDSSSDGPESSEDESAGQDSEE